MFKQWYNDFLVWVNSISYLERFTLGGLLIFLSIFCFIDIIRQHYNKDKFSLKIGPLALFLIFMSVGVFILAC